MLRLRPNSVVALLLFVLAGADGCAGQMTTTQWRRIDVPGFFSFHAPPEFPDALTHSRGGTTTRGGSTSTVPALPRGIMIDEEPARRGIYEAERGGIRLTLGAHGWGECGYLPSGWRSENIRMSGS